MVAREAPDPESLRLELQEAIVTYRHWLSQVTQISGFIIAGTTILVSYGLTQKIAAILLIVIPAPMLILLEYLVVGSIAVPLGGLILRLERRLHLPGDSLGATYSLTYQRAMIRVPEKLEDNTDGELRHQRISWRFFIFDLRKVEICGHIL